MAEKAVGNILIPFGDDIVYTKEKWDELLLLYKNEKIYLGNKLSYA